MESPPDKIAVLPRGDPALSVYPDAARMPDDLADHVLGQLVLGPLLDRALRLGVGLAADRPLGDVVRPLVGVHARRGVAEYRVEAADGAGYSAPGARVSRRPLLPRRYRFLRGHKGAISQRGTKAETE